MPITSQDVDNLLEYAEEKLPSDDEHRLTAGRWKEFFDVRRNSKRRTTLVAQDESMPAVRYKPELVEADELQEEPGFKKAATKRTRGGAIVISMEAKQFDNIGKYAKRVRNLVRAFDQEEEINAAALFDFGHLQNAAVPIVGPGGFPIIDTETADKKPFFSALHFFRSNPTRTYSNRVSPASADQGVLEAGMQMARQYTTSVGSLLAVKIKRFVSPTGQFENLVRILRSEQQSDSANNAINPLNGVPVIEWPDLRDQAVFYAQTTHSALPRRDYAWDRRRHEEDMNGRIGGQAITYSSNYADYVYDGRAFIRFG